MALRTMRSLLAPLALAAVFALSPSPAHAQSGADKAAAEALFQQAQKLLKEGELDKACAKFDASQKLDAAVGTLLYLGDCYEKTSKTASAWATFVEAASLAERTNDKRKKLADVRVAALAPQVSKLTINVASGNEGSGIKLRRNGVEVSEASWGTPLPLDAGSYQIEASAPGKETFSKQVEIKDGGDAMVLDVPTLADATGAGPEPGGNGAPPEPQPPKPPTSDAEDSAGGSTALMATGFALGGLGLVGFGVGTAFGLMAKSKNDESLEPQNCRTPEFCTQAGLDLRDDARGKAAVSTGMFIAGGVLLAGGVVMIVVANTGDGDASNTTRLELAPSFGPEAGALSLRGSF
jgi:serine/threonine-protein kinase